jgi:hypothetical protein
MVAPESCQPGEVQDELSLKDSKMRQLVEAVELGISRCNWPQLALKLPLGGWRWIHNWRVRSAS